MLVGICHFSSAFSLKIYCIFAFLCDLYKAEISYIILSFFVASSWINSVYLFIGTVRGISDDLLLTKKQSKC